MKASIRKRDLIWIAGPLVLLLAALALSRIAGATKSPRLPQQSSGQAAEKAQPQNQAPADLEKLAGKDETRPAEQVYKNVQVLKGMPADQFIRTMKGFTNALGVRCEFCHVTAPGSDIPGFGAFSKDDLEQKKTARAMIVMVGDIRERYFGDKQAPTCWTCHRGNKQPEFAPPPKPPAPAEQK
jgi:Photosynthetic reaction centre cytochrome C subunit